MFKADNKTVDFSNKIVDSSSCKGDYIWNTSTCD